jgi:uncharacterized protein involved in propanediol utilization
MAMTSPQTDLTRTEIEALIERLQAIAVAVEHPATMLGIAYDRATLPGDAIRAARALKQLLRTCEGGPAAAL